MKKFAHKAGNEGDAVAATIRDITRATGLSVATVSKYINGGNVLPENRILLQKAIEDLKYEVNEVARGLATSRTKTIGVLLPSLDSVFACTLISHVEDVLRENGYGTIICDNKGDTAGEKGVLSFLLSKRVDGIICIPSGSDARYLTPATERGVPVVLIDRAFGQKFDSVLSDNLAASRDAIHLLAGNGHSKIGIICGTEDSFSAHERLHGYVEALRSCSLSCEEDLVHRGNLTVEQGYEGFKALLARKNRPSAVYLTNYEITLGAVIAMNEMGVRVPEDISVVGFDNLMLAQVVRPRLWMVVQPMREIAQAAARIMLGRLDGSLKGPKTVHRLKTNLLEGQSVRKIG